jgi:hypothetical protein
MVINIFYMNKNWLMFNFNEMHILILVKFVLYVILSIFNAVFIVQTSIIFIRFLDFY